MSGTHIHAQRDRSISPEFTSSLAKYEPSDTDYFKYSTNNSQLGANEREFIFASLVHARALLHRSLNDANDANVLNKAWETLCDWGSAETHIEIRPSDKCFRNVWRSFRDKDSTVSYDRPVNTEQKKDYPCDISHLHADYSQINSKQCVRKQASTEKEVSDSSMEESETDTQKDKVDQAKRKPGKLDLRQYVNITTAIGKLNVQNTTPNSNIPMTSSKSTTTATDATPSSRRLPTPRHNHGRAVAPPQLPSSMMAKNAKIRSNSSVATTSIHDTPKLMANQADYTRNVLLHPQYYKVSGLSSPFESESAISGGEYLPDLSEGQSNNNSGFTRNLSIDSSEALNYPRSDAIRQLNEILANKQPPGRPGGELKSRHQNHGSSFDLDQQQQAFIACKKTEKEDKKDKKKLRDEEKQERRKMKEEERLRRQEEEKQRRQEKKYAAKKSKSSPICIDAVDDDGIPLFIKRCIEYIELEGLDAEGIYRVPGNRAHVETFVQKFKENPDMSILESDIPVNAVATALKDFLSKIWSPIIPVNLMKQLTELANISNEEQRVEAVRDLVRKLPPINYIILRYVFSHFVKVSLNHTINSMNSKNLAICLWPTLLPLQFDDMVMFERMRPHLEQTIQTLIDQYDYVFCCN